MAEKKSQKIDKTLQNLADDTWKASSPTSSSTDPQAEFGDGMPGDPNCPLCHGLGYLRKDVPLGHPEFGKVHVCSCRSEQISQQVRRRLFELSHLDELSHLTFENFEPQGRVGNSPHQASTIEVASNQSHIYSQKLEGWLVLRGGYGCGKTHLAAAIANFAVSMGVPTLFITVPDLLDMLRFAYNDPEMSFEERFEQIRGAALLVLDDFGTQNATAWAQEKLFQIINFRYINHLPLVVTTNLAEKDIEERIQSRLNDADFVTVVHMDAPDFRNPKKAFGYHELSSLDQFPGKTFENFDLRENDDLSTEEKRSLKKALQAAQKFAKNPQGWLVFIGSFGSGKTHLAAAIGNYRTMHVTPPMLISVPDLLDHLRATFSPHSSISLDRRFEEIRHTSLLILDDLGTQSTTPWAKEKLYQLFNYRYNAELPTVITSSTSLEDMDPRLRSRMLDRRLCEIFAITVSPYTGTPKPRTKQTSRQSRT